MTFSIPFGSSDEKFSCKNICHYPMQGSMQHGTDEEQETGIQIEFSSETDAQIQPI